MILCPTKSEGWISQLLLLLRLLLLVPTQLLVVAAQLLVEAAQLHARHVVAVPAGAPTASQNVLDQIVQPG